MLSSMVWSAHPGSFPFLFIFRQDVCVMSTDSPLEIPLFLTLFSVFIDFSCFCSLRSLAGRFETKLLFLRANFVVLRQTYFPFFLFSFFNNRKFNIQPIHLFFFLNILYEETKIITSIWPKSKIEVYIIKKIKSSVFISMD